MANVIGSQSQQASSFTVKLDTRAQEAWLKRYTQQNVLRVLDDAAKKGATAGVSVLRAAAPVSKSSNREGQYYRKMGLTHGTFKKSIRAAKIRGRRASFRGIQGETVGYVMGPMGKNAFTRAWIEFGTAAHDMSHKGRKRKASTGRGTHPGERGQHWTERAASASFSVARSASEARLVLYGKGV